MQTCAGRERERWTKCSAHKCSQCCFEHLGRFFYRYGWHMVWKSIHVLGTEHFKPLAPALFPGPQIKHLASTGAFSEPGNTWRHHVIGPKIIWILLNVFFFHDMKPTFHLLRWLIKHTLFYTQRVWILVSVQLSPCSHLSSRGSPVSARAFLSYSWPFSGAGLI